MKALLLLAHATPSVIPLYEAALPGVKVVPFVAPPPGMSAAYVNLANTLRAKVRTRRGLHAGAPVPILPDLLTDLVHVDVPAGTPLIVASWSGGYALLRELAKHPEDVADIAAWVLLDGGHTSLEADGTALDAGVLWAVDLAQRGMRDELVFAMLHSDVRTPQTGPQAYASTTQFAAELLRLAGPISGGGFILEAYNGHPPSEDAAEHIDALRVRGPAFIAEALERWTSAVHTSPAPRTGTPSFADLALNAARAELALGVQEEPLGSNTGARVRLYLSGCVRSGKNLKLTAAAWCAAFIGWCSAVARGELRALGTDVILFVEWRASVAELVRDAYQAGTWRLRGDGYIPLPGDRAVFKRNGQDPSLGGEGHVAWVDTSPDSTGHFYTIGGNEDNRVKRTFRHIDDPELLGWIVSERADVSDMSETVRIAKVAVTQGLDRSMRDADFGK